MSFTDLGLSPETLQAVAEVGYTTPTPIQEQAIPWVLMGRDVMGIAQTGTGKTASFTLPMIDILANGRAKARMPRSLIIAPTRELANQAAENFTLYGKYHKLSMALLIGGESFTEQEKALDRGVDVLIATPGRLLDLFDRGRILLRDVKVLVIDEADRMLDMGFIPDVERIVSLLPPLRQTLFFSATMDDQIRRLADAFLTNPKEVRVARQNTTAETVAQYLAIVDDMDKRETLRHILRMEDVRNAFIFCNRKRDVDILYRSLRKHGFDVAQLHGDMPQNERTATLANFKAGNVKLLVCSDVAARGIDIADVSHVFNFDVPHHAEDYVHRIGRTGRAGREGRAFTIASSDDGKAVTAIEKLIATEIPRLELEGLVQVGFDESGDSRRRRRGGKDDRRRDDRKRDEKPREDRPRQEQSRDEKPAEDKARPERSREDRSREERPREDRNRDRTQRDGSSNRSKDNTVARDGKERDGRDRDNRDRDRNTGDRTTGERNSGDRNSGDRRGDRRRREGHPAHDVPEMAFGDDVLAFGGQTPAFMLAPLTLTEELALRPKVQAETPKTRSQKTDAAKADTAKTDLTDADPTATVGDDSEAAPKAKRTRRRRSRGADEGTPAAEVADATSPTGDASEGTEMDPSVAGPTDDSAENTAEATGTDASTKDSKPRRPAKTSARIAKKLSKKQHEEEASVSPATAEDAVVAPAAAEDTSTGDAVETGVADSAGSDTPAETEAAPKKRAPRSRSTATKAKAPAKAKAAADSAEADSDAATAEPPKKKAAPRKPSSRSKAVKADAETPDTAAEGATAEEPKKPIRRRAPRKTAAPAADAPAPEETPDA